MPDRLSHLDEHGAAHMVDVGDKPVVKREAIAEGQIWLQPATLRAIADGSVPKGDVLATARIAGIMAAKRCGEWIPLCHPLPIEAVSVDFVLPTPGEVEQPITIHATCRITAKTGIEMEALTAVSAAALTIYDMCKAIDKTMRIEGIRLVSKTKTEPNAQAIAMQSFARAYEPWTEEEDERLRCYFADRKSIGHIAQAFHRQPSAIESRLKKLGLVRE